jgi:hypothetical protein
MANDRRKTPRPGSVDRRQPGQQSFGRGTSEFSELINRTFAVLRKVETQNGLITDSEEAK